ncbi:hypothetical protein L195_g012893 [Trifolium pratense]|uniref:Uncharacterized protein n=1 Tax=Trifolium pratense TaxID=57577 RepID=A0A2K3PLL1_TRIPR|nr:hypothetical protein L195_g012893 [Trifolium pratense]
MACPTTSMSAWHNLSTKIRVQPPPPWISCSDRRQPPAQRTSNWPSTCSDQQSRSVAPSVGN